MLDRRSGTIAAIALVAFISGGITAGSPPDNRVLIQARAAPAVATPAAAAPRSSLVAADILNVSVDRLVSTLEPDLTIVYAVTGVPDSTDITAFYVSVTGPAPDYVESGPRHLIASGLPPGSHQSFVFSPADAGPGVFLVGLSVASQEGTIDVLSQGRILVQCESPPLVTVAADPRAGHAPLTIRALAGAISPGGFPVTFEWSFGDGTFASGVAVTHTFDCPGSYDVRLVAVAERPEYDCPAWSTLTVRATGVVLPTYGTFQRCFGGNGTGDCACSEMNNDGRVDLRDYESIFPLLTGW